MKTILDLIARPRHYFTFSLTWMTEANCTTPFGTGMRATVWRAESTQGQPGRGERGAQRKGEGQGGEVKAGGESGQKAR